MLLLNPFLFGRPVHPSHHVGHRAEIHTLFSRLANGESSAIVGEPHIGKSSLLCYLADKDVQHEWLGKVSEHYICIDIDCEMLPADFTPNDFWQIIIARVRKIADGDDLKEQCRIVFENNFGSFTLEALFKLLAKQERRVVLLIDEFDTLLHHPNFNKAEFFGALRAFASHTDGLAIITASRMSVAEMNRRSHELNPFGSPFFNNSIEVRLKLFAPEEAHQLVETTLQRVSPPISFSPEDYAWISKVAGQHPFLVQVAGSAIYDAIVQGTTGQDRYEEASKLFRERAGAHFEEMEKMTTKIFLSYARADSAQVEQLYQKLAQAGHKPWMDTHDILPGEQWQQAIKKAVRKADFFIACLSNNSVNRRGMIQKEIKEALDVWEGQTSSDIYLIPLRLEVCPMPEELERFQWVDIFASDGWDKLIKAIEAGIERRNS